MTDLALDPAVVKLLEYAKDKKVLSWDELNDLLPETIINTEKMDQVLILLEQSKIQILEEETASDEEAPEETKKPQEADRKRLVYSDKD